MKKRGEVGVHTFVQATAILIALVLFLLIVPKFSKLLFAAGESGECQWNVLVSSLTRTPGVGIENIPIECQAKYMNVTLADVQRNYVAASVAIAKYDGGGPPYASISSYYKRIPDDVSKFSDWSMQKIVADEMVSCWDKVWKGELPLFDTWYNLMDYENIIPESEINSVKKAAVAIETAIETTGTYAPGPFGLFAQALSYLPIEEAADLFASLAQIPTSYDDFSTLDYLKLWNAKFGRPPVFCIVCTRIKFDESTKLAFANRQIDMVDWLKVNPVPRTQKSYYEYIIPSELLPFHQNLTFSVDEPLAILYTRIPYHQVASWTTAIGDFTGIADSAEAPDKVNRLHMVPYSKVILPYEKGGANCDFVID